MLRRMTDALAAVVDVRLRPPRQGDADDGHGLLLDGPGYDRWASLLATGAALFGPAALVAGRRPRGRRAHRAVDRGWPPGRSPPGPGRERRPSHFADAGMTLLRATGTAGPTSSGAGPTHGPHGYLSIAAHAHADALAVEVRVGGVDVLADPGTYCYGAEPAWRAYFRSTVAHNTLEVGGVDQSVAAGPHLWTRQARAELEEVAGLDGGPVAEWRAAHHGYRRLRPPAVHRRTRPAGPGGAPAGHRGPARQPRAPTTAAWPSTSGQRSPAPSRAGRPSWSGRATTAAARATLALPEGAGLAAPGRPDRPAGRLVLAGLRRARARRDPARRRPGRPAARLLRTVLQLEPGSTS